MHCLTAPGQWAVLPLRCTASLPGASRQCNSCYALPHCLGAVGSGIAAMELHCLGVVGSGNLVMQSLPALGQWAVQVLQCSGSLPAGSGHCLQAGQCNSCNALPHCLGQWAAELVLCTATLPGAVGSGIAAMHWHSAPGAVCSGTLAMHCHTPRGSGQYYSYNALPQCLGAVNVQCTTSLPWVRWPWNSYNALLQCLGAVCSRPHGTHCLTAWG